MNDFKKLPNIRTPTSSKTLIKTTYNVKDSCKLSTQHFVYSHEKLNEK